MIATKVSFNRINVYAHVAYRIIEDRERRTWHWLKPWNGSNAAGRIATRRNNLTLGLAASAAFSPPKRPAKVILA